MNNYYTSRELRLLDDYARDVLPTLIQEDFRINKGANFPAVFSDLADMSYKLAEAMLAKRKFYSEQNPYMSRKKQGGENDT